MDNTPEHESFLNKVFLIKPLKHLTGPILWNRIFSISLIALVVLVSFNAYSVAIAAGGLDIEIIAGYNLVVDSNVLSPSTAAPSVATVVGKFCNTSGADLTGVWGYIGDYSGGTPGLYPTRQTDGGGAFDTQHPHLAGTPGVYSFTHIGGSQGLSDASRYIGTIPAGECRVQYWHFTYPRRSNLASSNDNLGPDPVWGETNLPNDDLWLDFDVWGYNNHGVTPTATDNQTWQMTMRNEISAMANKIEPHDGAWFNTASNVVEPGETITSNGIQYDIGNVNKGFDNDGDFDYDYNVWLQPVGDPNFDPSCFRLIGTYGELRINSASLGTIVIPFTDKLYFSDEDGIPTDVTGGRGDVYYTFMALDGPCNTAMTPYQEMASGADNEKFNADYGTALPQIGSSEPMVELDKSGDVTVIPGNNISYTIDFDNTGSSDAGDPDVGLPLVVTDAIPTGTALTGAPIVPVGYTILYSEDGGSTWVDTPSSYTNVTHIQVWADSPLTSGTSDQITFSVNVPGGFIGSYIENCSQASFGRNQTFTEACTTTMVQGSNNIGDFVWKDDDGDGIQDVGEVGIANVDVYLYLDIINIGTLDVGDLFIGSTSTDDGTGPLNLGEYKFENLPDGNFIVTADRPSTPVGYSYTTADTIIVTLAAADYWDADFGFGPILDIIKTLTTNDPAYEGETVTFKIELINTRPASGPNNACMYTDWATAFDSGHACVGCPKEWLNVNSAFGTEELDELYAYADYASGAANEIAGTGFTLAPQGNITKMEVVFQIYIDTPLINDSAAADLFVSDAGPVDTFSFTTAELQNYIGSDNPGLLTWDITGLGYDWADLPNFDLVLRAVKATSADPVILYLDAMGVRVTTDQTCGGAQDTIDTLPLTDDYDADILQYVTASPNNDSLTFSSSPYPNTGTLTWNDLGPLYGGEKKTITVTFKALEPPGTSAVTTTNYADVTGATFFNGDPVNSASDDDDVTINPAGTVGDFIWNDIVNDGVYDPDGADNIPGNADDEVGIPGVTVELQNGTCTPGSDCPTDTTDASGIYLFEGVPDGTTYTVVVDTSTLPNGGTGWTNTSDRDGDNDSDSGTFTINNTDGIGANDDVLDADFAYNRADAIIEGSIWHDWNRSGTSTPDTGEEGLAGLTVIADDGICDVSMSGNPSDDCESGTTDSNGDFTITGLGTGTYDVCVTTTDTPTGETDPLSSWTQSFDTDGTGTAHCVQLTIVAGTTNRADYSYYRTGSSYLEGTVWTDWDGDGVKETGSGEEGIPNVRVYLYEDQDGDGLVDPSTDTLIDTDTTDTNGDYGFPDKFNTLAADDYIIKVEESDIPATYIQTGDPNQPGVTCTACDSRYMQTTDGTSSYADIDFGYQPRGTSMIGDLVFVDVNRDGIYDSDGINNIPGDGDDETGISGITVYLYEDEANNGVIDPADDALIETQTTDTNGNYLFITLPNITYLVEVKLNDPALPIDGNGQPYVLSTDYDPVDVVFICVDGIPTIFPPYPSGGDPPGTDRDPCDSPSSENRAINPGEAFLDADFGFTAGGTIGDFIWQDNDRDGSQDIGEPGLAGATVTLYTDVNQNFDYDAGIDTQYGAPVVTGADGLYEFTSLPTDYYVVVVTPPAGYIQSGDPDEGEPCLTCNSETGLILNPGQIDRSNDFGYYAPGQIGDKLWIDSDGDGSVDIGEPGIINVTVNLFSPGGDGIFGTGDDVLVDTQITNGDGEYFFGIPFGDYEVRVDGTTVPVYLTQTYDPDVANPCSGVTCDEKSQTTINGGNPSDLTRDFGYQLTGTNTINGTVYHDTDKSGTFTIGEPTFAKAVVKLWFRAAPTDPWIFVGLQETDDGLGPLNKGEYSFTNLPDGYFTITVEEGSNTDPSLIGLTQTEPTPDSYWQTGLISGGSMSTFNFGFYGGTIGDLVWNDTDQDGEQDVGEPGITNVTVNLYDPGIDGQPGGGDDSLVDTTTTDANGNYIFYGLLAGDYFLEFVKPANYLFSPQDQAGGDDTLDSDANTSSGQTIVTNITLGENDISWDAGMYALVAIGNFVWLDNGAGSGTPDDGIVNGTEAGINGVSVELYRDVDGDLAAEPGGDDGAAVSTTTTNNGEYIFDTIGAGLYFVHIPSSQFGVVQPLENHASSTGSGGDDANDQDVDENGVDNADPATNGISTSVFDLQPSSEPVAEFSQGSYSGSLADDSVNMTVDFGFLQQADLSLTKTVSDPTPNVGDTVTFTITVTNNGPSTATNVVVDDTVPNGYTYAGTVTGGDAQNDAGDPYLTWTINSLASGNFVDLTFTATVLSSGDYDNWAEVDSVDQNDPDSTPGNDSQTEDDDDSAIVTPLSADLSLTKTVSNPTPNVGDTVTFTIRVTNNGPDTATNVVVDDTIPNGYTYAGTITGGDAQNDAGDPYLTWTINSLASGNFVDLTFTATVLSSGDYDNWAEVDSVDQNDPDSTPGNDSQTEDDDDNASVTPQSSDLSVTKMVSDPTPNVGDTVTFTIRVTNNGPDAATNITIDDTVPNGYTYAGTITGGDAQNDAGDPYLTWTINSLTSGNFVDLTFTATVLSSGDYDNWAEVDSVDQNDPDSTPGNDSQDEDDDDNASVTPQSADLELLKSVSDPTPNVGDTVTFTIRVTNNGPDTATNIFIDDTVPNGYSYAGTITGGDAQNDVGDPYLTWTINSLASGNFLDLTFTATVLSSGDYDNWAEVDSVDQNDPDSTPGNDSQTEDDDDNASVTPQSADLELLKSVSDPTPNVGDTITFTIRVTNNGPDAATNVVVDDTVPNGYTYAGTITGGDAQNDAGAPYLTWTINSLASGNFVVLTFTATVNASGDYDNWAEVDSVDQNDPDSTPGNDSQTEDDDDNASVTPTNNSDLELLKSVSDPTPNVGDTVTFTITVTNNGPSTATNVIIDDTVPNGYTYAGTITSGDAQNDAGAPYLTWTINSLASGNFVDLTFTATVLSSGDYDNWAEVDSVDQNDPDSTPGNDSQTEDDDDNASVTPQSADLELLKSVSDPTPNVGDTVTFTIRVTNNGPDTATNVVVDDTVPNGYTYTPASIAGGDAQNDSAAPYLTWTINSLASGNFVVLTFTATVNASGDYDNWAEVDSVDQNDPDSTPGNDSQTEDDDDNASVTPQSADLELLKSVSDPTPNVGDTVTFTIRVTNNGPDAATNVVVDDTVPNGYTYAGTITGGDAQNDAGAPYLTWTINSLASGNFVDLTFTATVNASGDYDNWAEVDSVDQNDPDSTPGNDSQTEDDDDNASVTPQSADLELLKSVSDPTPNVGDTVTFTIRVTNNGPDTATNVVVDDTVPNGYTYAGTITGGDAQNDAGDPYLTWTINSLASGNFVDLTFTATVLSSGDYDNWAEVDSADQYDPDSTPGNDSQTEDDDDNASVTPQSSDLSLTKTVSDPTPNVGDTVTFTITVTNNGPDTATNITIDDTVPNGYTYAGTITGGDAQNDAGVPYLTWTINSLASVNFVDLTFTATVNASGDYDNWAEVDSTDQNDPDSTPGNGSQDEDDDDNASVTPQSADLELLKSVSDPTPNVGDTVTFTIRVTNNGPDTATNVVVDDTVPTGYTYTPASIAGGDAQNDVGDPYLTWTVNSLASSNFVDLTFTATVLSSGDYDNWAEVDSVDQNDPDSTPGNDSQTEDDDDNASVTPQSADLELLKSVSDPTPNVGDTVTFTIRVTNNGPDAATNVVVDDTIPNGYTYAGTITDGDAQNDAGAPYLTWTINSLASGNFVDLTFTATVLSSGDYDNWAEVDSVDQNDPDSTPGNDSQDEDDDDNASVTPTSVSIGDFVWNDVDGDGNQDAGEPGIDGVTIELILDIDGDGVIDAGEPILSTQTTTGGGGYDFTGLAVGDFIVNVTDTGGVLTGYGLTGGTDPHAVTGLVAGQDYNDADFGYHEGPVSLSKSIVTSDPPGLPNTPGNEVAIGEIVEYQIQVTFAPGTYTNATITDILDRGLAYVTCIQAEQSDGGLSISAFDPFDPLCPDNVAVSRYPAASTNNVDDGREIVFNLGTVTNSSGGNQVLTLIYQVVVLNNHDNNRGDSLENGAYYGISGTSSSAPPVTIVEPTLGIRKTSDVSTASPGEYITFSIEIYHEPSSDVDAFDVVVRDTIPPELIYDGGSLQWDPVSSQPPTTLSIAGSDIIATWDVFLDDDTTSVITFRAQMGAVVPGTTVINTASVEWSSLPGNDYRPPNQISPHNDWSTERWYDPADTTGLNTYGGIYSSAVVRAPTTGIELPATGFAPYQWSEIPQQPKVKAYQTYGEIWLEIPSLGIKATIVGIPLSEDGWDATWLWNQAGYLQGTAFPTWEGNTVITSHVYLPNGLPGPFVNIGQLSWGDEIIIHAFGQRYVYQVRERRAVLPYDMSVIGHKEEDWVTLLTCSYFEESSQTYRYRLVVQAVLISYGADVP